MLAKKKKAVTFIMVRTTLLDLLPFFSPFLIGNGTILLDQMSLFIYLSMYTYIYIMNDYARSNQVCAHGPTFQEYEFIQPSLPMWVHG